MVDFNPNINALRNISTSQRVSANNVANVESSGFKESRTVQGTQQATVTTHQQQGGLVITNNLLDFAIKGDGYITFQTDQGAQYSRTGTLSIDKNGVITNQNADPLNPSIPVPAGSDSLAIASDGNITAEVNGTQQTLGQLSITTFPNPGGLTQNGDGYLQESIASGTPVTNTPESGGAGSLVLGGLESSNVNLGDNFVTMIINQSSFAYNIKAISIQEEMDRTLLSIKG